MLRYSPDCSEPKEEKQMSLDRHIYLPQGNSENVIRAIDEANRKGLIMVNLQVRMVVG